MAWNTRALRIEILHEFALVAQIYRRTRYKEFVGVDTRMHAPTHGKGYHLVRPLTVNIVKRTPVAWKHDIRRKREKLKKRDQEWRDQMRIGRTKDLERLANHGRKWKRKRR